MKAMILSGPSLGQGDIPQPKPRTGELLIRVLATGITPTERIWYPTLHTKDGTPRIDAVPCHEFCGEVAELGDGATGFSVGQTVYGLNDWFDQGALAEYCVTRPEWIAAKPNSLTCAEAASVPIGALTAWQGLIDRARLQAGDRVLIHGGAGAVGVYAIQLARLHGAVVTTTVSARNVEFVKELGANHVVNYQTSAFEDQARDMDVVFDAVGGETLRRSWGVLKPNGRMVTIAADVESTTDEREKAAFFIVEPNQTQLFDIGRLLDTGRIRAVVDVIAPFSQSAEAFDDRLPRSRRGKVVIEVPG